jgi:CDP-diacylglycerol--glycerol-3-phosphate 3-phosphatidyltransferase
MNDKSEQPKLTLPNLLTGFRFVAAPGLLWLARQDYALAFMGLLAVVFLSDLLDGMVARWSGQVSQFGATLDSCADVVTYLTIALSCWWLWPDIVLREFAYVTAIVAGILLPTVVGLSKFGCFTSYHTWAVKLSVSAMGLSLYVLFFGGPAWPFRMAALLCLLAAVEEVAITLSLPRPESDVRSIWHVMQKVKQGRRMR